MRIETEDSSFAVHLAPAGPPYDSRFFVFKLRIGDVLLGDGEPALEWTSVAALARLCRVDDPRVDPDSNTAGDILDLLTSEDDGAELYDRTLTGFGEGLDAYTQRAYLWRDEAVFLFRENNFAHPIGSENAIMARIKAEELRAIAAAAMAAYESYNSAE